MKTYCKILAVLIVVSLVLAIPDFTGNAVMLTFGLAIPLFFVPTVLYYLLALFPGFYFGSRSGNKLGAAVFCIIGLTIAATAPVISSFFASRQIQADLVSLKISSKLSDLPRTIEIVRPDEFHHAMIAASYPESNCGPECKNLIESGQVDWIRLVLKKQKGNDEIILYKSGKTEQECKVPSAGKTQIPCVLVKPNNHLDADLLIQAKSNYGEGKGVFENSTDERYWGWIMYSVFGNRGGKKTVYRDAQQSFRVLVFPALPLIRSGGMHTGGFELLSKTQFLNQIDYKEMLRDLGYKPSLDTSQPTDKESGKNKKSWRDEPTPDQTRDVLSVLKLPTKTVFNRPQKKIINRWINKARSYKEWTPELAGVVANIYKDSRVDWLSHIGHVSVKDGVSQTILPLVLADVEKGVISKKTHQILWETNSMNRKVLLANRETILRIARRNIFESKEIKSIRKQFKILSAYLGVMPEITFNSKNEKELWPLKIQIHCYLEPTGNPVSIEFLRNALTKTGSNFNGKYADARGKQVIRALASHGDMETVRKKIANSNWANKTKWPNKLQKNADDRYRLITNSCRQ